MPQLTPKHINQQQNFKAGMVLLIVITIGYCLLILQMQGSYLPVWSDEFFYYTNAASFFKNSTLKAALTFNGSGSRLLGADAHGFAYPVLNGGIAKIFGWGNFNIIYTNFFFIIASLAMVWFQKIITGYQKILITAFILLFPFFVLYGFTYMQESIHIFFSIACSILIYKIHINGKRKYYFSFVFLVAVAALFRPLWLFWLIGLIPFAKSRLQFRNLILIFVLGITASFFITYYFTEAVPNYFSAVNNLFAQGQIKAVFFSLVKHFAYNLYAYFFSTENFLIYLPIKYLIFATLVLFVFNAIKYRSKLHISIALIGVLNFLLLFLFYDVFKWREIRVLAPFFYFCIPFWVTEINNYLKYLCLFVLAVLFILTLPVAEQWIEERNIHSAKKALNQQAVFDEIGQNVSGNAIVLVNYLPTDSTLDLISLPLQNVSNSPIRYIIPYYNVKKVKYNYTLNRPWVKSSDSILIANQYYKLERNN
jgi:hypothetical protein